MERELELIKKLQSGNTQAMQPLMEKYQDYVYTLLIQIVKSKRVAEDLTQDVFIKIYKRINTFKAESKFSTWIYTIAYRTGLNYLDKKKIIFNVSDLGEEETYNVPDDDIQNALNFLQQKDLSKLLWQAIDELPVNQGLVISLFYLQQFSVREISQMLDISDNTVKTNLFRGRNAIKSQLSKSFTVEELL